MQVGGVKPVLFRWRPSQPARDRRAGRAQEEGRSRHDRPCRVNRLPLAVSGYLVPEGTPKGRGAEFAAIAAEEGFQPCFPGLGNVPPLASPRPLDSGARLPP